jgi:hypothetical protein
MRLRTVDHHWLPYAVAALGALLGSCTVALQRDHEQCRTSADCRHLARAAVCTSDGLCESLAVEGGSVDCLSDRDCAGPWSICFLNACHQLDQAPCMGIGVPDASDASERLPFAVLVPDVEMKPAAKQVVNLDGPTVGVAQTVLQAFAAARKASASVPEVIGVACPAADAAALQRLTDAGVRLVIGPLQGDAVLAASDALQRQAVLFAASADAPTLLDWSEPLASDIVSCKPNSADSRSAQLTAVTFVQAQLGEAGLLAPDSPTVLARRRDEERLGYALESPDVEQVTYEDSLNGQGLVRALSTQRHAAGLIVAPSGLVDWSRNIKAVDADRQVAGLEPPYYLLRDKQGSTLDLVATGTERRAQRTAGLDFALSDAARANQQGFVESFTAITGNASRPGLAYVHDCLYVALYAALAAELRFGLSARELSAQAVLLALEALVGGEERVNVAAEDIPRALELLQSGHGLSRALDLTGGSGELDFEPSLAALGVIPSKFGTYVRPSAGASELYCFNVAVGNFCDTSLRFPTTGEPPQGVSRCDCFPLR